MMDVASPHIVATLVADNKAQLLFDWRAMLRELQASRGLDRPTLDDHVPQLIDEIVAGLRAHHEQSVVEQGMRTPAAHGRQRFDAGFDLLEVVAEFNMLRDCLQGLVESRGHILAGDSARIVHHAIDTELGGAIESYIRLQDRTVKQRRQEHLAFVAHDLRSPLSVIITAVDMLELAEGDRGKTLSVLRDSAYRLNDLVSDVLKEEANLSQDAGIAVLRTQTPLRPVVQRILDEVAPIARRNDISLRNDVPSEMIGSVDTALLARVLQNLVGNALRYAKGRSIAIAAREDGKGGVVFEVADTGEGIPANRIAGIFAKGSSGAAQSGMGYGLAIARQYVEAHGGRLDVDSTEGHGATFTFDIPADAQYHSSKDTPSPM